MTRAIEKSAAPLLLLLLAASFTPAQRARGAEPPQAGPAGNWWSISDADFVAQYGNLATGAQAQQSQFAWMAFARANQQVAAPTNPGQKFSQWELWPSDPDTFTPDTARFELARKVRTRPHLQPLQQLRVASPHRERIAEAVPFPQAGQEVTRNSLSYDYIMGNTLNTAKGIAAYLQSGKTIQFPLGVVEVKAWWVNSPLPGAYQVDGLSLTALHLMVKVKPTPSQPFSDNTPSWFWTTFEYNSNPGLAAARKFVTYPDVLAPSQVKTLMSQAGLGNTPFVNYSSNGQQLQFSDANHPTLILGNTQLEWPFALPATPDPTKWTQWNSSCHTCHAQASGIVSQGGAQPFTFTQTGPVGTLSGVTLPGSGYQPYDFVWGLMFAQ